MNWAFVSLDSLRRCYGRRIPAKHLWLVLESLVSRSSVDRQRYVCQARATEREAR